MASKLEPSWDQMRIKSDPKTNQKNDCFLEGFQVDFGWILAPSWDPGGGHLKCFLGVLRGLGAILGPRWSPRWSQEAPRGPQTTPRPILIRFWWIFVNCLVDFWWIFGRFSFESWCVGVLGCWLSASLLGLFAQLVIGWGSLRQARWRGLPSGQLDNDECAVEFFECPAFPG